MTDFRHVWNRVERGWELVCAGIRWAFIAVSSPVWGILWLIGTVGGPLHDWWMGWGKWYGKRPLRGKR